MTTSVYSHNLHIFLKKKSVILKINKDYLFETASAAIAKPPITAIPPPNIAIPMIPSERIFD